MNEVSSSPNLASPFEPAASDRRACFRCGYDLRGMADDQPCPECGLLASRSRQLTLQLRDAKPGYLRRISIAIWLLLAAIVLPVPLYTLSESWRWNLRRWLDDAQRALVAIDVFALFLLAGVWLLMRREPGIAKSRNARRTASRLIALFPLPFTVVLHFYFAYDRYGTYPVRLLFSIGVGVVGALVLLVGLVPLPMLVWRELRDLGRRLLSRQLTEHSSIVGAGMSITIAAAAILFLIMAFHNSLGISDAWMNLSNAWLILMTLGFTSAGLFWLWGLYLLVRFAVAFWNESRARARAWRAADFSRG